MPFFKRRVDADKGLLYDHIEPGEPIVLDEEEERAAQTEIARGDPSVLPVALYAALALRKVAGQRYAREDYRGAANSCVKSVLMAQQPQVAAAGLSSFGAEACAHAWLLLARVHASAGRFREAGELLAKAEKLRDAAAVTGALRVWSFPVEWAEVLGEIGSGPSLKSDIKQRRRPRPPLEAYATISALIPTSRYGWFDDRDAVAK